MPRPSHALSVLRAVAEAQTRGRDLRQARRAARAYGRLFALQARCAVDSTVASAVAEAFAIASALQLPLRGYRRAHRSRLHEAPEGRQAVSDEEVRAAVIRAPSIKVAAGILRVDRGTVARRVKALMRQPVPDAALASAVSLQRSRALREKRGSKRGKCSP